jgi:hypothetical protein
VKTSTTQSTDRQLWGIYYTDREYARLLGDPLRAVVEASSKSAAEEAAGKLGFESPWAHPVTAEQIPQALWIAPSPPKRRQKSVRQTSRGIRI